MAGTLKYSVKTLYVMQVLAFNGQPVKNLKSLADMVESCADEFLKFDLEYQQVRLSLSLSTSFNPFLSLPFIKNFEFSVCR